MYNEHRHNAAESIALQGGPSVHGGHFWFRGGPLPDGSTEEFNEDCAFTLHDFTATNSNSHDEQSYAYDLADINTISNVLEIPWKPSKDVPFSSAPTFIGFTWDLERCTVSLAETKRHKYILALQDWSSRRTHTLHEAQKLLGKLTHTAQIFLEDHP